MLFGESSHVMRNVSSFRLREHTLKVEAAAWLEGGSRVCDQCPGEDEHVQNEVHALFILPKPSDSRAEETISFLSAPFFEDFQQPNPLRCNR